MFARDMPRTGAQAGEAMPKTGSRARASPADRYGGKSLTAVVPA
eukprot:CAMPEP_0196705710 /NCGR_PEP_ID=MMETSP1090-20130531/60464_1 /TAXON_ID=37098 /ORGANISM="Isochrysis sp, Strain CCMP1244" /LENGTH=43 /DNA_ID= /DNA_START= /DNA_END= /DNA_ORIENTATION=